ncbi:carboxylating nicotinate-nucleotide diphosphorylase [Aestuariibacter halophilus]|uniref:nicotinate-nucleotide diphosphorylase (carboxylating) n=1 Tax=Fluctibacter halophilus TaxID=226011 RepID=A0ABS8GB69_9ALTE|nr:carboxylating nicotinate-nucleotide diphosphorylase [Aestuariibacter halophilus]MCC2616471.1 carboxylating nicotinate-nucleotide diphosphorylase [Aestuariibacter halophilus]
MQSEAIRNEVTQALLEDLGGTLEPGADITAQLIPAQHTVTARVITREPCILAGQAWATASFELIDDTLDIQWQANDGDALAANDTLFTVTGSARHILTAERTALNYLQTLSATATQTAAYVKLLDGSGITLLDTRKTLPGMRMAQKHAVRCGGGQNHRVGLYDAYLIKENHIMACGSIDAAVTQARQLNPGKPVEVEVETLDELAQAIAANADIVMLDNFTLDNLHKAVAMAKGRCKLEVSGNITDQRLQELRTTGVDFISSGALTKNVQAIDLSMRIVDK